MDLLQTGPVALAERRLSWLDARQRLLAQNIANADTPGFRAQDAVPFADILSRRLRAPAVVQTDARHIAPTRAAHAVTARTAERTPNGNTVSLDEQAIRMAETDNAHALAMGLHRKYLGLFRTALGRTS
jgi:flagellar basal-body rod protein FlgB